MDYKPRYAQPFTLTEAKLLDVETITEEIARLQNSLQRLHETQQMLREYISMQSGEEVDVEIAKVIEENETVIGSQLERISILKMALAHHGIVAGSHYDIPLPSYTAGATQTAATHLTDSEDNGGIDI
ncbi:hypothetical protein B0H10DRAFT_1988973 [Mycena sp. CBHHK59/15]|nr:hypothetical protein B0H10DRAFT_1988973 [Mycena sp. CBHHK59/15]